ncbi:MAG: hypothetical protein KDK96_11700 [Chlamydiia bacterium]|nr:hypothetical protein [Chlamydiia bacterium]
MEPSSSPLASPVQDYQYSPDHQYQKYCSINLSESVSSEKTWERVYKVAAVIAMIVGAVLLVGVVAGVAIGMLTIPGVGPALAALIASLVLVGGVGVYRRVFYEGFENKAFGISFGALPWTKKAEEYRRNAELNESIAKMAEVARQRYPELSEGQSNLIGRIWHWEQVAKTSHKRMDELKAEIHDLKGQIAQMQASCSPEELKPIKENLGRALREYHRVTASEHIAAKVKAAYFRHIKNNPTETHAFDEFGTLETDSYLESMQGEGLGLSSNIFYTKLDQPKRNWSVFELMPMDSKTIAQEIFSKKIRVA